jgi:putative Ca2+/H+ antiporter (TMEM165/GDT1 family)
VDIAAALRAFGAVFPAELPDKTMIATIVLVAHHRRALPVWCGAAAAFTVHVTLAVLAGQLLRSLPSTAVSLATAVLFAVGAVLLWRGARDDSDLDADSVDPGSPGDSTSPAPSLGTTPTTSLAAFAGSFGVVMLAEAGDLTQLATAGLAASSGAPLAVAVGALAALWLVAGLAVVAGRQLTAVLPLHQLRRAAAVVFAVLAVVALLTVVR